MTIVLSKPKTQIIWRSPTPGNKTTTIPGSDASNNGYTLDIKTTLGNGETHFVYPTSGTIGGLSGIKFVDTNTNLFLRSNAAKSDWIIRCLCSYAPASIATTAVELPFLPPHIQSVFPIGFGWLQRFGQLSGAASSSVGTLSIWMRPGSTNGALLLLRTPTAILFKVGAVSGPSSTMTITVQASDGSGSNKYQANYSVPLAPPSPGDLDPTPLSHLLLSYNVGAGAGGRIVSLFVDDVAYSPTSITTDTGSAIIIPWADSSSEVYMFPADDMFNGWIGFVYDSWFDIGRFTDFSVSSNRRKFDKLDSDEILAPIDSGPSLGIRDLGANGENPFGAPPAVFCHIGYTPAPVTDFYVNRGTGGGFTLAGRGVDFTVLNGVSGLAPQLFIPPR